MQKQFAGEVWAVLEGQWLDQFRPNTRAAYGRAYHQFSTWLAGPPDQLAVDEAQLFAEYLRGLGLAARTINLKLAAISSFYEFCRRVGAWPLQAVNPFLTIDRMPTPRTRDLPPAIVAAIFKRINLQSKQGSRDFALLFMMVKADLTPAEVINLTWGQRHQLPMACKGPLADYLRRVGRLETIGNDEYMFPPLQPNVSVRLPHLSDTQTHNGPISLAQGNKILKKYAKRAGYKGPAWLAMLRRCQLPTGLSELSI